jgi:hypothetical protein
MTTEIREFFLTSRMLRRSASIGPFDLSRNLPEARTERRDGDEQTEPRRKVGLSVDAAPAAAHLCIFESSCPMDRLVATR